MEELVAKNFYLSVLNFWYLPTLFGMMRVFIIASI